MLHLPDVMPDVQMEADWKTNDKKVDLNLENVLQPYLWSLRVAGVYYLDGAGGVLSSYTSLSIIYCILVNVIVLLHAGHMVLLIPGISNMDEVISAGTPLIWTAYILLVSVCMLHYCTKKSGWRAFFVQYRTLLERPGGPDKLPFKRRCWKYVIATWVVVLANVIFTNYLMFWTSAVDMMAVPFKPDSPAGFGMKVASMVAHSFCAVIFSFSVLHTVIMADLLGTIFKEFNTKCREYSTDCMVMKKFHRGMSGLVASADSLVSVLMGVQVTFNLMMSCAVGYTLIYNPFKVYTTIYYMVKFFWLVISLGAVYISSGIAAWLNIQAHGAFDILQDMKLCRVTDELTLQMTLFVSKLHGTQIGFTVANMFCLDKNAIMTFTGVLLTYFFLMLQFRPSMSPQVCDCTSWLSNHTLQ